MVTWQRPEHPHNSAEFAAHTGLTHVYPKYMVGGGYVVSADVARMIVATHQLVLNTSFLRTNRMSASMKTKALQFLPSDQTSAHGAVLRSSGPL